MVPRSRATLLVAGVSALAICGAVVLATTSSQPVSLPVIAVALTPATLAANGFTTAQLSIATGQAKPTVSLSGNIHGAVIEELSAANGQWRAQLRAGIVPGPVQVRISAPGYRSTTATLTVTPDNADTARDGTPDFLRLDNRRDRAAFRQWFTWLAEAQYFRPAAARPKDIDDCAALLRYAYREALHAHDTAWANSAGLPLLPSFGSVEKYDYPFTPLRAGLFRTRPGPYVPVDAGNGTFLQFADAETLWRYNSSIISRNITRALPGDLLFFRQPSGREPFHAMIYLGRSQLRSDDQRYVVYHTGPTGADPGEMRRLTVDELLRFPQPEWRPIASNPSFLGVARWNILSGAASEELRD